MRLDSLLKPFEGVDVLAELVASAKPGLLRARGTRDISGARYQFIAEIDPAERRWAYSRDRGAGDNQEFRNGVLSGLGAPITIEFERGMPDDLKLLYPAAMRQWGRPGEEFYPLLVQSVGRHSYLLTFEHLADAAFRSTAVFDRETGVFRKSLSIDGVLLITDLATEGSGQFSFADPFGWDGMSY